MMNPLPNLILKNMNKKQNKSRTLNAPKKKQFIETIKITDGIFITSENSLLKDKLATIASFLSSNKITHVINAAQEVPNLFEATPGLSYLSLPWKEMQEFPRGVEITKALIDKIYETIGRCK
jgi:hypothetical protein